MSVIGKIFGKDSKREPLDILIDNIVIKYHKILDANKDSEYGDLSEIPELTDEKIRELFRDYFNNDVSMDDAGEKLHKAIDAIVPDAEVEDYSKGYEERPEYKIHHYHYKVNSVIYKLKSAMLVEKEWIKMHGKRRSDEEAAKMATEKIMELCFGWHIQDNGALNEDHSFKMSMFATALGSNAKDKISEEVKQKAYDIFYEYFMMCIQFAECLSNESYIPFKFHAFEDWLKAKLPKISQHEDNSINYNILGGTLYCDYHPDYIWRTLLENAGVEDCAIDLICPWKTTIGIRMLDNAIIYGTYGKMEYL